MLLTKSRFRTIVSPISVQWAVNSRFAVWMWKSAGGALKCLPGGGSSESHSSWRPLKQAVGSVSFSFSFGSGPIRKSPAAPVTQTTRLGGEAVSLSKPLFHANGQEPAKLDGGTDEYGGNSY